MPLHLVTQQGQPYGSVRQCCEVCGKACGPYWHANDKNHLWTEDPAEWEEAEDNCLKVKDLRPSLLLRDGVLSAQQQVVFMQNKVGRPLLAPEPGDDEEEGEDEHAHQ